MTRIEAIAAIAAQLATLDDERLRAVAALVQNLSTKDDTLHDFGDYDGSAPEFELRPLSAKELALIEQSKEDFQLGRTFSGDEARAIIDERLAKLGVPVSRL
jgi:hypothetical protein